MIAALVKTPLSQGYLGQLEKALGCAPELVNLNTLLSLGLLKSLRELRRLGPARLVVPAEDVSALNTLPILQLIAALTRATRLEVATPNCALRKFSRVSVVPILASFLASSVLNILITMASAVRLRWLERRARVPLAGSVANHALYINSNLWFGVKAGGSVGHVAGVINALARRGLKVDSAACGRALLLDDTVGHVSLVPPRVFGYPVELNNYRFHRMVTDQLDKHIAKERLGFIYQRLAMGNFTGVELSRKYGLPLITEYNGSEAWIARNWGRSLAYHDLAVRAEQVMLHHSHLVVTISDVLRKELQDRGVAADRIVMYPNCIDPRTFDPARFSTEDIRGLRGRYGISDDAIVATFVGTFGQWHGVDVLATCIRTLLDRGPEYFERTGLRFLLVGDGMKMGEVRSTLDHPLASRFVTLTGLVPQHEAPLHLAASDILLSPHVENPDGTRFFGSPTKLFEYMAMGKPIVASDLDQIGEVLANGLRVGQLPKSDPGPGESRLAVLGAPGNETQLLDAVQFLVDNPRWRGCLGVNVRQHALSQYTWDRHVDEILQGFSRVWGMDQA
jgi:glycosyltransferase involved in cell wall biosynthesis